MYTNKELKNRIKRIVKLLLSKGLRVMINETLNRIEVFNSLNYEPIGYIADDATINVRTGCYKSEILTVLRDSLN